MPVIAGAPSSDVSFMLAVTNALPNAMVPFAALQPSEPMSRRPQGQDGHAAILCKRSASGGQPHRAGIRKSRYQRRTLRTVGGMVFFVCLG
jgi:hypothetical protein